MNTYIKEIQNKIVSKVTPLSIAFPILKGNQVFLKQVLYITWENQFVYVT